MSLFSKIIISLIAPELKNIDFTDTVGFKDCYTSDPDHPTGNYEFYIMFKYDVYNEFTIDLSKRLSSSFNVKKCYTKRIDGIPYIIYSFFVRPEVKPFYKSVITLTFEQKLKYIQFWSDFDKDADKVKNNSVLILDVDNNMPIADYVPSFYETA